MSVQTYLDLITSQHQDKPKFMATVSLGVGIQVQIQGLLKSIMNGGGIFDLSLPPVGNQLDMIGEWVGISRDVAVPITGVFFSWDGVDPSVGWEFGTWRPPSQATTLVVLPDDVYLTLIKAKIAANHWDGTTEGAYAIWAILLPAFNLLMQDNQNMSFIVAIQGGPLDSLTQALLLGGYLPLRPEGVKISAYVVAIDTGPFFAWDSATFPLGGWDSSASWGVELIPA